MTQKLRNIFLTISLLILSIAAAAQGTIQGRVTDKKTGEPIAGVTVLIVNSFKGTVTDAEGRFKYTGIAPGTYEIRFQFISYKTADLKDIVVAKSKPVTLDVALEESAEQIDQVVVVGTKRNDTDVAVNMEMKNSFSVVSAVSSQIISKTQDKDASEVVKRIPGISIIDDKFIVARGLAQRYNNVWINNAAVPSSEADSRAFSFDIIPSSQIDNIFVLKSPSPEIPADFAGGFIKINTKDVPDRNSINISYGIGINDRTHFRDFRYNPGSSTDLLGFDNGRRKIPGGIKGTFDNNNAGQVTELTRNGFNNDWRVLTRKPIPDQKFSFMINRLWKAGANKLALSGALNYSYTTQSYIGMDNSRFGIYNKVEDKPEYLYKYTDDQYNTKVRLGAMLNLSYIRAKSRFSFRNIFNQLGHDRYTYRTGWQNISSLYIQEKSEYAYSSRSTYNGQFSGVHTLAQGKLDWNAGYSYANKNQPDRRIINRQQNDLVGDPDYGRMGIDQNDIQRDFTRLDEHIVSGGVNYEHTFNPEGRFSPVLRAGAYGEYRTRKYNNRAFYYRFNQNNLPDDFVYGDVIGEILQSHNMGRDKLYLYDDTDNRDSYNGNNTLYAGYIAANIPLGKVSIYGGVRYESNKMELISYTRSNEWTTKTNTYDNSDLFPSASVTYNISKKHLVRAAYGASVNRPEFRELSSSVYYDFDLFSDVKGNPDLQQSRIQNIDLRYEWYPSPSEIISLGVFYKHFDNPIEYTFLDAGGSYTYTFENADKSRIYGIELDLRKDLGFMGLRNFTLSLNCSLMDSEVLFGEGSLEHDRPMQGQSPYIVNAGLFYQPQKAGLTVGLLYNRLGKRIVGIGRMNTNSGGTVDNDIPDMYEMPRNSLDFVISKSLGKRWELKFNAKDLMGEAVVFSQFPQYTDAAGRLQEREQVTKRYYPGRSFSLTVGIKL